MNIRVSVAMAVYNGEKYLKQQIDSILKQLGSNDELIISIDPSNDNSKEIALKYAEDSRVRVYEGPGKGAIRNFENALNQTKGEYIFLADQDDVWTGDKISEVLPALQKEGVYAAVHDAVVTDKRLNTTGKTFFVERFYPGIIKNIIRNRYIGCCMAFKKAVLGLALPFPANLPMHDQWLGITAKKLGEVVFIAKPLLYYRRHGRTVTGRNKFGILKKLSWRISIAIDFLFIKEKKS